MITINLLALDITANNILLDATTEVGNKFTKLVLWDALSYKDTTKAIDLTNLLIGTSNTEIITIPVSTTTFNRFSGLFFIELTSDEATDNTQEGLVANFIKYQECLLDKALSIQVKDCKIVPTDCGKQSTMLFVDTIVDGLYAAIQFKLYQEAISMITVLDELCVTCDSCPELGDNIMSLSYGFKTVDNQITML